MIVLGNDEFATGMRFAGLKRSFPVKSREQCLELIKDLAKDEFILCNVSIMEMVPELKEFANLVTIPDDPSHFSTTDDLKEIIKSAIGFELG